MARVERLLLIVAIVAIGWYASARVSAKLFQDAQLQELEELRVAYARDDAGAATTETRAVEARAANDSTDNRSEKPARARRALVGRIDIPRLGVSAIIREGVDDRTLDRAVGRVPGTGYPGETGNLALAAHRDSYFADLKHIRKGDRIDIRTPEGDFTYVVHDTRVVPPTDVSVLEPTDDATLTLITCYPFNFIGSAPDRFIVQATAR